MKLSRRNAHRKPLSTKVVNIRRKNYTVYIGRGSIWGNPFVIGNTDPRGDSYGKIDREGSIKFYEGWFLEQIKARPEFREQTLTLQGEILGCYCKPRDCHGDVIKHWLEGGQEGGTEKEHT